MMGLWVLFENYCS